MMKFVVLAALVALCLASCVSGQPGTWEASPYTQTLMMGINMLTPTVGFIAGAQNGEGSNVLKTEDGAENWAETQIPFDFFLMTSAAQSETSVVAAGAGITQGSVLFTTDGNTFTNASEPHIAIEQTQFAGAIEGTEGKGYIIVGSWQKWNDSANYNGVALSQDAGASWAIINVTEALAEGRYGAFPAADTWYVTFGIWPQSPNATKSKTAKQVKQLSRNIHLIHAEEEGTFQMHYPRHDKKQSNDAGWVGQIFKTTDGGESWSMQYTNQSFYFNQISCVDTETCVAVGENDDYAVAYRTTDGGATWTEIFSLPAMSLFSVETLGDEVWLGGGVLQFPVVGAVFYSNDGGDTFTQTVVPDNYFTDIDFVDSTHGFGTSLDTEQESGVMIFKASAEEQEEPALVADQ